MAERERLFGSDLRVVERAGGVDLITGRGGDIDLAQGVDNIVQALTLRLLVRRGELAPLGLPDYGSRLHELIGEPNNRRTQTILMAHARNALLEDPRVLNILNMEAITLAGERDVVRLNIQLELIHSPNPLNLVFDASVGAA